MGHSPVSCSVHGSQRRQVVRAAQVSVQPVLSGRQVSGGGGARGGGEELHGGGVVGGAGAGVHPWTTNKDGSLNAVTCPALFNPVSKTIVFTCHIHQDLI